MNCSLHTDVPSVAFCQFCGKPLCKDCVRNVGGAIYCESCLAERLRGSAPGAAGTPAPVFSGAPHPLLAGLLGVIPGVGAMYNGQYAKAIAHVLIFAVLASLSDHSGIFGVLVAAWVFYQVFDAYQTAVARRDGLALPNPFGLNDIAQRLGIHAQPGPPPQATPGANWEPTSPPYPGPPPPPGAPQPGMAGFVPTAGPGTTAGSSSVPGYPPNVPGYQPVAPYAGVPAAPTGRDLPVGAIILIGLGILFLFGSLGLLHADWVARGWPLLIIGLGLWIILRRSRANGYHNHPMPPVAPPQGTTAPRSDGSGGGR